MSVAKVIKVIASSNQNFHDAVQNGVAQASKSVRNISAVKVLEMTADVDHNTVSNYKVTLEVAFKVQDE